MQALRRESDSRALVLLDEVGTGTDPVEGAALGAAILRALVKGGARGAALTFATTHHRWATGCQDAVWPDCLSAMETGPMHCIQNPGFVSGADQGSVCPTAGAPVTMHHDSVHCHLQLVMPVQNGIACVHGAFSS